MVILLVEERGGRSREPPRDPLRPRVHRDSTSRKRPRLAGFRRPIARGTI